MSNKATEISRASPSHTLAPPRRTVARGAGRAGLQSVPKPVSYFAGLGVPTAMGSREAVGAAALASHTGCCCWAAKTQRAALMQHGKAWLPIRGAPYGLVYAACK